MLSPTPTAKKARRSPPGTNIGDTNNRLPSSSDISNLDSFYLADGLAKAANSIMWARHLRGNDRERIPESEIAIGYYSVEDLLDATAAKRNDISTLLTEAKGRKRSNVAKDLGIQKYPGVANEEVVQLPRGGYFLQNQVQRTFVGTQRAAVPIANG